MFYCKSFEFLFNTEMVPIEMLTFPFTVALILWKHPQILMEPQLSCASSLGLVGKNEYVNMYVISEVRTLFHEDEYMLWDKFWFGYWYLLLLTFCTIRLTYPFLGNSNEMVVEYQLHCSQISLNLWESLALVHNALTSLVITF